MKRRSFLQSIGIAIAASVLIPKILIEGLVEDRWRPNPAWEKAEYEIYFYHQAPVFDPSILQKGAL